MARVCQICGKGTVSGKNRSHSMRKTCRTYKPNLQTKKILFDEGLEVKIRMCTKCYKTYRVAR